MVATGCRISTFGIFLLIGGLWLGTALAVADDAPLKLPPIPEPLPATAQPLSKAQPAAKAQPQGSPFKEESKEGTTAGEECEDVDASDLSLCGPPGRIWLRADYLLWWTSGMRLPPLVTTSPQGTDPAQAGVLRNAEILYGEQTIDTGGRSGFRTTIGLWLDSCHLWGAEVDYFNLGEQGNGFYQDSPTGNPILARPFFNVQTNQPGSVLVSYASQPGHADRATGSIGVDANDYFQSGGRASESQFVQRDIVLRLRRFVRRGVCHGLLCAFNVLPPHRLVDGLPVLQPQRSPRDYREHARPEQ